MIGTSMLNLSIPNFFCGWMPAVALAAAVNHAPVVSEPVVLDLGGGFAVPLVSAALGALGIALSRPLARKSEAGKGAISFLLTSAIMLIVTELWIIETRPSWLFAFVIAIGLGFSGYSLIELVGTEISSSISSIISRVTLILQALGGKLKGPKT